MLNAQNAAQLTQHKPGRSLQRLSDLLVFMCQRVHNFNLKFKCAFALQHRRGQFSTPQTQP